MSTRAFRISVELRTELHAGSGMTGNVLRTRPYAPGKLIWGAVTQRITRTQNARPQPSDYVAIGQFVREHLVFGCLFPSADGLECYPGYGADGIRFGGIANGLDLDSFECRFLSSRTSTALDPALSSAAEGSLHESEHLRTETFALDGGPRRIPVMLTGYAFIRPHPDLCIEENEISVMGVPLGGIFKSLQLGGDRSYGFGLLGALKCLTADNSFYGHEINEPETVITRPYLPFPAFAVYHPGIRCVRGELEPVVGREWQPESGAGELVVLHKICWTPGAVFAAGTTLRLGSYGVWEAA